jgi:hypothetical protein
VRGHVGGVTADPVFVCITTQPQIISDLTRSRKKRMHRISFECRSDEAASCDNASIGRHFDAALSDVNSYCFTFSDVNSYCFTRIRMDPNDLYAVVKTAELTMPQFPCTSIGMLPEVPRERSDSQRGWSQSREIPYVLNCRLFISV